MVNGLVPHYYEGNLEGDVLLDGKSVSDTPLYDLAAMVGSVFQNPKSQFFNVDTDSELAFACENLGYPQEDILKRIDRTVSDYHIEDLMGRSVFALSGGEKQKIACASSSVLLPGIMVLDEPSSNLDVAAIDDLRQVLSLWKKQGKTILIAEHRLYYLHDLADRVLYVKDGEIEREYTPAEFDSLSDSTRKEMGLRPFSLSKLKPANQYQAHTAKLMEFQNFCFAYKKREPESLHIPSAELPVGETIAIIGLNGAGKSTLARCICGLEKKCGLLQVDGKTLDWKARLKHCYMVMQDTSHQLFTESVMDEVLLSICQNQLGRRNLDPERKKFLMGKLYESEKLARGGSKERAHDENGRFTSMVQNDPLRAKQFSTCERIAAQNGVGAATVKRAEKYAKGVDAAEDAVPGAREEILTGRIKATDAEITALAKTPKAEIPAVLAELRKPKQERQPRKAETSSSKQTLSEISKSIQGHQRQLTAEERTSLKASIDNRYQERAVANGSLMICEVQGAKEDFIRRWNSIFKEYPDVFEDSDCRKIIHDLTEDAIQYLLKIKEKTL